MLRWVTISSEVILRRELSAAVAHVNATMQPDREHVACVHWDFARHMKPRGSSRPGLTQLTRLAAGAIALTGVFAVAPSANLEAAAAHCEARNAGASPTAQAAQAWCEAECELVTGTHQT